MSRKQISFGPFRLDEPNECLWSGSQAINLRPKAYAVLRYLVENPATLVTKQQLLDNIWPDTFVTDAVLKDCIRQLREVLGDDAKAPKYIETAHRRGYRFIAELAVFEESTPSEAIEVAPSRFTPYPASAKQAPTPVTILDREEALTQMQQYLAEALGGRRQVVFITGEAGIGKTTLVDAFLEQASLSRDCWIAKGQCLEQYGESEAYLPVLEAFNGLVQERKGAAVIETLRRHAPTWLIQMPSLTSVAERAALQEEVHGVTRERMLREMAEAMEAITAETPVVMILEDLHWCDYSTLDLISYLARRRTSARLLLIGSYRPLEIIISEHPLRGVKQDLQLHGLCTELPLEYLTEEAIAEYLRLKFPSHQFPDRLASMIHRRTEGNPLFMISVVEYLLEEKLITNADHCWKLTCDLDEAELGVPENIRHLIEKHIERLTAEEQRILEVASVVGMDCSAVAISAGLNEDPLRIEEVCDQLARRQHFLLPAYLAELPDGTITPRYQFIHSLYLDVLYKRVAPTRRARIHGRIGQRGESIYGERVGEIAAELAVHFEESRDFARAVKYLSLAAENAARRSADREAVALASRGLELLKTLPDGTDRADQEASLSSRIALARGREQFSNLGNKSVPN